MFCVSLYTAGDSPQRMARKEFLKQLQEVLLISTLLTLCVSVTLARHRTQLPLGSMTTNCRIKPYKELQEVEGPEGCEPTYTRMKVCSGICPSHTLMQLEPPFTNVSCSCCAASSWNIKPRRLNFTCNGVTEEHRIFLPIAVKCGCINCYQPL